MRPHIVLAQSRPADDLLSAEPLAPLIGMVLDQQIPLEKAFRGPQLLAERLDGPFTARSIADCDPEVLRAAFVGPPALHRFPGSMADRVQAVCSVLLEQYDGDARQLWTEGTGAEIRQRVEQLPGFGPQKARIFLALLGKQYGVTAAGWREAAGDFGADGSYLSVADIVDEASLQRVRAHKKELKEAAGRA